jgi:hypothetical protein
VVGWVGGWVVGWLGGGDALSTDPRLTPSGRLVWFKSEFNFSIRSAYTVEDANMGVISIWVSSAYTVNGG